MTRLETKIKELNERVENMCKVNSVANKNLDDLRKENVNILKQNKSLHDENLKLKVMVDSERKEKDDLLLKNNSLVKSLFACDKCEKTFTDKIGINQHIRSIHVEQEVKYDLCGYIFKKIENLKQHTKCKHGENSLKEVLLKKLNEIRSQTTKQKVKLYQSIYNLKQTEIHGRSKCSCKGLCLINHSKYRWIKSESDSLSIKC